MQITSTTILAKEYWGKHMKQSRAMTLLKYELLGHALNVLYICTPSASPMHHQCITNASPMHH
jgi:hypothetical protein